MRTAEETPVKENDQNTGPHARRRGIRPAVVVLGVAILSVLAMLLVDHGPWSRPAIQTADIAIYRTTGEAARAAGATVTTTPPKPRLEPLAPGPKPAQPANPLTP
jgi:hypothetical protein